MKREILQKLNINEEDKTDKYLGLPVYVGRSRMKTFEYMKDKVWRRIRGWMEHMLSRTGMDMLIKSCAQAIPTFAMYCFDLTRPLCEQISATICRFWWKQQEKENKMHLLSWKVLTKLKM
jgi:hypothetical protein